MILKRPSQPSPTDLSAKNCCFLIFQNSYLHSRKSGIKDNLEYILASENPRTFWSSVCIYLQHTNIFFAENVFFTKNTHKTNLTTVLRIIRTFLDIPIAKVLSFRGLFKITFTSTELSFHTYLQHLKVPPVPFKII